jgi:ribonuclease BN (tRNA processing enzyme)
VTGRFSLTVLGCDGSYPGPGGVASGYLLRAGETAVWLDAGPGTLAQLQRHLPLEQLDAVVVSHHHVDHWSDLEHLAVACHHFGLRPSVPLYAETDLRALMRVGPASAALAWTPIGPSSEVTLGAMRLRFARTDHPVPTLAVRADAAGRSLGYSADSGPGWDVGDLGAGLHLALCEASHLADREGTVSHMSARQAGDGARRAGAERLVLTHLWPGVDRDAARAEAEASFGGPVQVARVGLEVEI